MTIAESVVPTCSTHFTLEHLAEAVREAEHWDNAFANDSSNNPNSFRSQRRMAWSNVRAIRRALKEAGLIPLSELEELYKRIDLIYPDAVSRQVVLFEGEYYQRRFSPVDTSNSGKTVYEWRADWQLLEDNDPLIQQYHEAHPDGSDDPLWDGWVKWTRPAKDRVCPKCGATIKARTDKVLHFDAPKVSKPRYFDRLAQFGSEYATYFYLCIPCGDEVLSHPFRVATKGLGKRFAPGGYKMKDMREETEFPVYIQQQLTQLGLNP